MWVNFFDWKLDFPEILNANLTEVIGFDIVIGNPPYRQLQNNGGELANLYVGCNYKTFARSGDIYCLFYERGYQLLKQYGRLCFITSNKWMRAGYGENIRRFFAENTNPEQLIDFAGVKVFESATVDTNILLFSKDKNRQQTKSCIVKKDGIKDLSVFIRQSSSVCSFGSESWVILSPIEQSIKAKIEAVGTPLKDWDIQINYGIKTGFNEAFIISGEKRKELIEQDPKSAEIIRPILRGRDIKRYGYDFADWYVILAYFGSHKILKKEYPAIYNHLLQYKPQLEQRGQCRYTSSGKQNKNTDYQGQHHWLELDNNPSQKYLEDFYKQKIIFQEMVQEPSFTFDNGGSFFCLDTGRIITGNDIKYLIAVLNSKLFFFAIKNFYGGGGLGETGVRMKHTFFEKFSCPLFNKEMKQQIEKLLQVEDYKEIDKIVYEIYSFTDEEIEFIETQ